MEKEKTGLPKPAPGGKKQKEPQPPAAKAEKRIGAAALIVLGTMWLLGGLGMLFSVQGFLPMGAVWLAVSVATVAWGIVVFLRCGGAWQSIVRGYAGAALLFSAFLALLCLAMLSDLPDMWPMALFFSLLCVLCAVVLHRVKKPVPAPKTAPAAPPAPQIELPFGWMILNRVSGKPFMDRDRMLYAYKNEEDARRFAARNFILDVTAWPLTKREWDSQQARWILCGALGVKLFTSGTDHIAKPLFCTETGQPDKNIWLGSGVAALLLRMAQNEQPDPILEQKVEWATWQSALAHVLRRVPLLVPFAYTGEDPKADLCDGMLHLTDTAGRQLYALQTEKDGREKQPLPLYYGMSLLTGGRPVAVMRLDGRVLYCGSAERSDAAEADPPKGDGKIMHPMFASNHKTGKNMVAVFTNLKDLKAMYPNCRVAAFSFAELTRLAAETDGIVVDPGVSGLNYAMDHDFLLQLKKEDGQPVKIYNLPETYRGRWNVMLKKGGEDKIGTLRALRTVTGCSLAEARTLYEHAPVMLPGHRARGEAERMVQILHQSGAEAEIQKV